MPSSGQFNSPEEMIIRCDVCDEGRDYGHGRLFAINTLYNLLIYVGEAVGHRENSGKTNSGCSPVLNLFSL